MLKPDGPIITIVELNCCPERVLQENGFKVVMLLPTSFVIASMMLSFTPMTT
jgi:hypothetical protein